MKRRKIKDVHTEHCCLVHGCKYGQHTCTVVTKIKKQSYPCEDCEGILPREDEPSWMIEARKAGWTPPNN